MVAKKVELPLTGGGGGSSGGIYVRLERNTQFGFSSLADLDASSEEALFHCAWQWPSGSAADVRFFGRRFEPRSGAHAGGAAGGISLAGIRTDDRKKCVCLRYHSTMRCCSRNVHPHCLHPSDYKLLHHALGYAT